MKKVASCLLISLLAACGAAEPTPSSSAPQSTSQTAPNQASAKQNVVLIDVRSPEEYQVGHLTNAHNIVHDQIGGQIASIAPDKNAEIHVYCRSGRRSEIALQTLKSMGYTNVKNLGGYDDLKNSYK